MTQNQDSEKLHKLNQSGAFLQIFTINQLEKNTWLHLTEIPRIISPFITNPNNQEILKIIGESKIRAKKFPEAVRLSLDHGNKEEMSIDISAAKIFDTAKIELRLIIEVKSRNPDYVDWCFLQQTQKEPEKMRVIKRSTDNTGDTNLFIINETDRSPNKLYVKQKLYDLKFLKHYVTDFGTALKKEQNRTQKNEINESARQVIKGLYGTIIEDVIHQVKTTEGYEDTTEYVYIPIILTNANLLLINYNNEDIDSKTGYINDGTFDPVNQIIYEVPNPKAVQYPTPLDSENTKHMWKSQILIMNPNGFTEFLQQIENSIG